MTLSPLAFGGMVLLLAACAAAAVPGAAEPKDPDARARKFIQRHEQQVRPLEIAVNRCWWTANISGKNEDYEKKQAAELQLDLCLSDPQAFAELKAVHDQPPTDPLLRRQIEVLYLQYLAKQVDPELLKKIIAKSNVIEQAFNLYRPKVAGKELTDNQVRQVLRHSRDSAERRAVWEASKGVGPLVEQDLQELVKLRNQAARKLGFKDYHVMMLHLGEQDQQQVLRLFDELDELTRQPFQRTKAEIDAALAKNCNVEVGQLRPWHYHDPYFQEAPEVFGQDSQAVYAKLDILQLCRDFYAGIGLPVDDILQRSDLYEKKGKNPHAFCTDIDRDGDVRVLANIVPNRDWLDTMLHELGHGVYSSKNIPPSVPYVLRTDAHALTTEGVAMLFGHFADSADWLLAMKVPLSDPPKFRAAAERLRRSQLLIFSRWCQVMFRFEKELYANPDQDLNRLWWGLVEKYQQVRCPQGRKQPDYAAKIHVVIAPVYYHNYMMGELFAAQLHQAIAGKVLQGAEPARAVYVGKPAVGQYFKQRVFAPARTLNWNQLTRHATGEELNPKAFAQDLTTQGR